MRTPVSVQSSGSISSVPSRSSSAKPRSTPITAPPFIRGRSAAATLPTCRRSTLPPGRRERTSPASMSTKRRPPQRSDQTGPSPWYATGSVTCSALMPARPPAGSWPQSRARRCFRARSERANVTVSAVTDDSTHHGHGDAGHAGHADHAGHAGHADVYRRRFWVCLILAAPVVVYSEMIQDWFDYTAPEFAGDGAVAPVLGTVIFFYGGWVFLTGAWSEIRRRAPGMMLLVSLAITVAFVASAASTLGVFDLEFWWELSALVVIMLLGHWQEMKALGQARGAVSALAELLPDEAERVRDGDTELIPLTELRVGDVVLVRPGACVPADGEILAGAAELDESMITGESRPVARAEGDRVTAGTVATDSAVRVRVTAVGEETALAGIERLVAEAQESRSRTQALADRAAALLFYVAVGAAAVTFVVWALLDDFDFGVVSAIAVLVISCPHALGLAIPLVISISTALAARNGILVKDRLSL